MADNFNKFMHPKNPYATKRPDFESLYEKNENFRNEVERDPITGKLHLNFKNPSSLCALTCALLKEDFDLDVFIPLNRIIPTIPQRLNYLFWVKDICDVNDFVLNTKGIDIGCGASCVFPLLGSKLFGWHMIGSDADSLNCSTASQNVLKNHLGHLISVCKVDKNDSPLNFLSTNEYLQIISEVIKETTNENLFQFCMCNPPFFKEETENGDSSCEENVNTKSKIQPGDGQHSDRTCPGGEVAFVRKLIDDSTQFKYNIQVYTTMLGHKQSLIDLKKELRERKILNFSTSEFCQGHTMRWCLAWSFYPNVIFPKSSFQKNKQSMKILSLSMPFPPTTNEFLDPTFKIGLDRIGEDIKEILNGIQVPLKVTRYISRRFWKIRITPTARNWAHQRRLRRQIKRFERMNQSLTATSLSNVVENDSQQPTAVSPKENFSNEDVQMTVTSDKNEVEAATTTVVSNISSLSDNSQNNKSPPSSTYDKIIMQQQQQEKNCDEETLDSSTTRKRQMNESSNSTDCSPMHETPSKESSSVKRSKHLSSPASSTPSTSTFSPLLTADILVMPDTEKKQSCRIEFRWVDGNDRQLLHEVMQFVKNQLTLRKRQERQGEEDISCLNVDGKADNDNDMIGKGNDAKKTSSEKDDNIGTSGDVSM